MTWEDLKKAVDDKLASVNVKGVDVEINLIYIMDATDAKQLNIRLEDMMLEIDE